MASVERPLSAVLHDILRNVQDMVRSEMRLAKTEVTEELGKSASAGMLLAIGVLLAIFGVLFVLLAAVYALSNVVPAWAAALIVGGAVALIAAVFVGVGITRVKRVRGAPKTAVTMKENVQWAKQLTR